MEFSERAPVQPEARRITQVGEFIVEKPKYPAIRPTEGLHFQIREEGEVKNWQYQDPKDITKEALIGLAVGRVVAEGKDSPDMWVNLHLNSRPPFDKTINVFGRNPDSKTGWGRPVVIREHGEAALENSKLDYVLERYVKQCSEFIDQMEPFQDGIGEITPESEEFLEESEKLKAKSEHLIWLNNKYSLVAILKPHLTGLHLVVHPRESYFGEEDRGGFKRPWQHPKEFMEMMGVVLGAQRVIDEYKMNFFNPEIHFSGNWSPDLKTIDEGGKLDVSYLTELGYSIGARKGEKKAHEVGGEDEWQTAVHGHLYATDRADQYVTLPERPEDEVPEQWRGIIPINEERLNLVEEVIQRNLTPWLNNNFRYRQDSN